MLLKTITAEILADDPDTIAPVSGVRCRSCGHNAYRDVLDHKGRATPWYVVHGAAYCQECRDEAIHAAK